MLELAAAFSASALCVWSLTGSWLIRRHEPSLPHLPLVLRLAVGAVWICGFLLAPIAVILWISVAWFPESRLAMPLLLVLWILGFAVSSQALITLRAPQFLALPPDERGNFRLRLLLTGLAQQLSFPLGAAVAFAALWLAIPRAWLSRQVGSDVEIYVVSVLLIIGLGFGGIVAHCICQRLLPRFLPPALVSVLASPPWSRRDS